MNKQIEALKLAIETMEFYIGNGDNDLDKSIQACKEALAEIALDELVQISQEMGGYD